jgi:type III pantothenate kinase
MGVTLKPQNRYKPMYLTLDIGNTRMKFAYFDANGRVLESGVSESIPDPSGCEALAVASVRSEKLDLAPFHGSVMELNSNCKFDFNIRYQTPETLGADRLAAVAGARFLFPAQDFLVVDAGTCLKFELLEAGNYLGGSIAPGLQMRYKALQAFTGRLPLVENRPARESVGNSKETAILAGVQFGFVAEVAGRIADFQKKNQHLSIILTGGDAAFLAEHIKTRIFVEPLLLHYGLYHTLRLNGY